MEKAVRKRQISMSEKLYFLQEVDKNPRMKQVEIAAKLKISSSTLNSIIKNREKIESSAREGVSNCRKRVRGGKFCDLEDVLLKWFKQARSSNVPLDGVLVREKASYLADKMGISDFKASNGWVEGFKKRHGIVYRCIRGEAASVDTNVLETWKDVTLPSIIKNYSPDDVFNADETGLFFNLLPDKSLVFRGEKCHGAKRSKERLTVLLCCNESGTEKLTPLVIGKYKHPRCFKHVLTLPCTYGCNSNAWMTITIFEKFLQALDAKMGGQNRKILLLIDNCAAHPIDTAFLRNVKVVFFPPNSTSCLQPLDQGIIRCTKLKYRKLLVNEALASLHKSGRKVDILKAMHFVKYAWDSVKPSSIRNCFRASGFHRSTNEDETSLSEAAVCETPLEGWDQLFGEGMTFDDYVACDNDVEVCRLVN
jgi:DNA-binding Lrp family transcriptional regulator